MDWKNNFKGLLPADEVQWRTREVTWTEHRRCQRLGWRVQLTVYLGRVMQSCRKSYLSCGNTMSVCLHLHVRGMEFHAFPISLYARLWPPVISYYYIVFQNRIYYRACIISAACSPQGFLVPLGYYHSSHAQLPQALVTKHLIQVVGARPGFMNQTL